MVEKKPVDVDEYLYLSVSLQVKEREIVLKLVRTTGAFVAEITNQEPLGEDKINEFYDSNPKLTLNP